ncbi:MAG: adenylate/guanylate cyclase domain-containing protein [Spirochaetales bacterium]|nr:adenylate/guanylate cyclase domain-containing protein [Spirochaetales bacterium]
MSTQLREQIEDFYLPRQLVDAILEVGGIPRESEEAEVGIGFIDIANYTFLSKFLTPKENQEVLNGLYTAFNSVLRRHGGYLNKIEGDSLMFHYGGLIDSRARKINDQAKLRVYIARELFYTCVEIQRVCVLFNSADTRFLDDSASAEERFVLERAFVIITRLRNDTEISSSLSAMFQIRIRIGANLGEVTIGNFGPEGARQWDVIGMPVIDAKRMESTAPVGGLRISRSYYEILADNGIVDEYYARFVREAEVLGSRYAAITREELFAIRPVVVREKANAVYDTCSIQVNPGLPEQIARQVESLLDRDRYGADQIVNLIQYYRGNRYVIEALETVLREAGVVIRRSDIYRMFYPKRFTRLLDAAGGDRGAVEEQLSTEYGLFELLQKLGNYQDIINRSTVSSPEVLPFSSYDDHFSLVQDQHLRRYEELKQEISQRTYFYNVVFPMVFSSLLTAILERQADNENLELLRG